MLRVSAGQFKGLRLVTPPGLRPTEEKVRQALFNILGTFIESARILDAYAGSGALGIEALSRGAAFVAFIESDTDAVMAIRDNLGRLGVDVSRDVWRLLHMEVERGMAALAKDAPAFDVIFFDPPYRRDEGKKALNAVVEYAMLAPSGIVVMEHERRAVLPESVGSLREWKRHRYGDTVLSFYRLSLSETAWRSH